MSIFFNNFRALTIFLCSANLLAQEPDFSKLEVQNDLAFLKSKLVSTHPNLFVYTTVPEFDHFFDSLGNSLPDRLNETEVFRVLTSTLSVIKDGHTYFRPATTNLNRFYNSSSLFPFQVFCNGQSIYITGNYSAENNLADGTAIQSINGIQAKAIIHFIKNHLQRDGNNTTYPEWLLNNFFTAYYSFFYGNPESFSMVYQTQNNTIDSVLIKAQPRATIEQFKAQRYPDHQKSIAKGAGIVVNIDTSQKVAVLTVKSFEKKLLRTNWHQRFKRAVRKDFRAIRKSNAAYLIIDIRGNQGGEISNGRFLLRHIMSEPFAMVKNYSKVRKKGTGSRIQSARGPFCRLRKPFKRHFTGPVYLLTDGGSFSCSAIVAQSFQQKKAGIIIGEETGGSAVTLAGATDKFTTLPNTGIQVIIPKLQFNLQDPETTKKTGVLPDIQIKSTISDYLNKRDAAMQTALDLIK